MNKLFAITTIVVTINMHTNNSYSQEIPISQLLVLQKYKLIDVEQYLKIRKWKYEQYVPENSEKLNQILWSFGQNGFGPNGHDAAIAWFYYDYSAGQPNVIIYQYGEENYYQKTISVLKSTGYILDEIQPTENGIDKSFIKSGMQVKIIETKEDYTGKMVYVYVVKSISSKEQSNKSILDQLNKAR